MLFSAAPMPTRCRALSISFIHAGQPLDLQALVCAEAPSKDSVLEHMMWIMADVVAADPASRDVLRCVYLRSIGIVEHALQR